MFIGSLVFTLFGLIVGIWSWRGRHIDDHPVCRRCGIDLFGISAACRSLVTICSVLCRFFMVRESFFGHVYSNGVFHKKWIKKWAGGQCEV